MRKRQQKCQHCSDPIPKGLEKYAFSKKLCKKCYFKLTGKKQEFNLREEQFAWLSEENRKKLFKI